MNGASTSTDWQKSACILCECNCGLEIQVEDGRLAKIRGDKEHATSHGYTCEKPLRLDLYQNGRDRLTSPLRRRPDGTYEEIDWDTAIREIAARLTAVKEAHGGERILYYSGAGQGNHLPAAYGQSLRAALGTRYYSNALAQEKTGEAWVDAQLYGTHTKGDFEHAEVVMFLGKNPWQTHSFPRARPVLKEIAKDPGRSMIVLDPRRSETAAMADFHLQVLPGTDAWCLAAMLGVLVEEDLLDHDFVAEHTDGTEEVLDALRRVPISAYAATCGVDEDLLRAATRRFATAASATTYEDLGVQQAPNSTLVSYLNKLLWILTGNFGRPGTMYLHSWFSSPVGAPGGDPRRAGRAPSSPLKKKARRTIADAVALGAGGIARAVPAAAATPLPDRIVDGAAHALLTRMAPMLSAGLAAEQQPKTERQTPVTGARVIAGLIPCNSIADEILTDHPERLRALWIDSSNPAHSLPESRRFIEAMHACELTVVVDVALTETAREADYVLPASSQYEKWECTFFTMEFPHNAFQLRAPLLEPRPGTLPEPEIYARLLRELGAVDEALLARLRTALTAGDDAFALALFSAAAAEPSLLRLIGYVLYETLGPTLPEGARGAAILWGAAHLCALSHPDAVARAGFTGTGMRPGQQLFDAILRERSGVTFSVDEWENAWDYVLRKDNRFTVAIPELLPEIDALRDAPSSWTTPEFPFVLMAGERRAFTANTIIRDPAWRRRDAGGALRISAEDAERLGLEPASRVRITTEAGSLESSIEISDMMRAGHVSLPNGLGLDYPGEDGLARPGIAPNELTSAKHRDRFAGTPWHKYVPARIEPVTT
ncbi:molybdopterin-dependent oxidoreductase [Tsukamurella tyrosinosolvens]|uniref:molybdopterin-dependent oxidoreductase n=1 Tax=Tsukamurella tyrosinosolvens TaxID=57704 RepID=UPI000DF6FAF5|nr:molybdopterin-dependent oxidoreductase [Tsukamurella tyrosinosolvens]RDB49720.1 molybdopterin oxidoreductase family protein [Tsukamurella tyrosinosolvens]